MKMTKLSAIAGLICTAVLTLISCNFNGSSQKEDFFGSWGTSYTVTEDNRPNEDRTYIGSEFIRTMYFDSSSKNLIKSGGAKFYMYKTREYEGTVEKSFYAGTYALENNNSKYAHGRIILSYLYGIDDNNMTDDEAKAYAALWINGKLTSEMKTEYDEGGYESTDAFFESLATTKSVDESNNSTNVQKFDFTLANYKTFKGYEGIQTAPVDCDWEVAEMHFDFLSNKPTIYIP